MCKSNANKSLRVVTYLQCGPIASTLYKPEGDSISGEHKTPPPSILSCMGL